MYPNRLRSGTLNLVLFRSCTAVQCGHIADRGLPFKKEIVFLLGLCIY